MSSIAAWPLALPCCVSDSSFAQHDYCIVHKVKRIKAPDSVSPSSISIHRFVVYTYRSSSYVISRVLPIMSATRFNSPHQHPAEGFEIVQLRGTRQAETRQKERPYTPVMTRTRESVDMMTASRTDIMARSHSQPGQHL